MTRKETPFTLGPWKATKPNDVGDIFIRSHYEQGKTKGLHVADLIATVSCGLNSTQAANARLIAAAPALLAALEELRIYAQIDMATDPQGLRWTPMMRRAQAAIARATGKGVK